MPGVLDFLFEGQPPKAVTTYGQTVENMPKWLSDYTQGLIGRANVIAAEPYQPYEGPRIAGMTPDQLSAYDLTRGSVGSYEGDFDTAGGMIHQAGSINPLAQAQPYLDRGTAGFPGSVDQYMDPYIQNVLNRNETLAMRNLNENVLPSIQDAFVGSGSFGGDRMAEIVTRAGRDISEGLQGQQLGALSQAYGQAGNLYGADATRDIQAGQTAGTLAGQGGELGLAAGQDLSTLAEARRRLQAGDAAGLEAVGGALQGQDQASLDLAYQDFLNQRDYPRSNVNWMSEIVRGLPHSTSTNTSATGPANVYQPSPLSQVASLYSTYRGLGGKT